MSSRHPLVVKLKSGEYDGKDIMEAWLLIEEQAAEIEQYRKWLLKELRRQQWGSDAIDEMLHEAGLPMLSEAEERQTTKNGATCDRCGAEYTTGAALQMHKNTTQCGTEKNSP